MRGQVGDYCSRPGGSRWWAQGTAAGTGVEVGGDSGGLTATLLEMTGTESAWAWEWGRGRIKDDSSVCWELERQWAIFWDREQWVRGNIWWESLAGGRVGTWEMWNALKSDVLGCGVGISFSPTSYLLNSTVHPQWILKAPLEKCSQLNYLSWQLSQKNLCLSTAA